MFLFRLGNINIFLPDSHNHIGQLFVETIIPEDSLG